MRLIDPMELKRSIAVSSMLRDGKTLEQIIDEQPTINQWIPCTERLPEVGKTVLVTVEADGDTWTYCDTFFMGSWMRYCGDDRHVTAWQELPEPWKGDGEI